MKEKQKARRAEADTRRMIEAEQARRKAAKESIIANRRERLKNDLEQEYYDPDHHIPPAALTCFRCEDRSFCKYVDDPYNTSGDCLAAK